MQAQQGRADNARWIGGRRTAQICLMSRAHNCAFADIPVTYTFPMSHGVLIILQLSHSPLSCRPPKVSWLQGIRDELWCLIDNNIHYANALQYGVWRVAAWWQRHCSMAHPIWPFWLTQSVMACEQAFNHWPRGWKNLQGNLQTIPNIAVTWLRRKLIAITAFESPAGCEGNF